MFFDKMIKENVSRGIPHDWDSGPSASQCFLVLGRQDQAPFVLRLRLPLVGEKFPQTGG